MGMNYQKKAIEIMDNVSKVIVGKEDVTKLVLTSLIAGDMSCLKMFREPERQCLQRPLQSLSMHSLAGFSSHRIYCHRM